MRLRSSEIIGFVLFIILLGVYVYTRHIIGLSPVIDGISPEIAMPGDILEISGKHFGDTDGDLRHPFNSAVYIGHRRMVLSDYISWNDTKIHIMIPSDIDSGFVVVETEKGMSNRVLFTDRRDIPVIIDRKVNKES
ncbi:MAG: IPT/TIG domain-containing protein [Spirochaetia bacterium]|nr:IPT/TIG domain-containing protein [Spirochaetia bacterium]